MKLSDWAREGKMPVPVVTTPSGRFRVVAESVDRAGRTVGYCRVSSVDQMADLECQAALGAQGRRIVVLDEGEVADDLVRDVTEILTSFCARIYGRRSAKRRADAAVVATSAQGWSAPSLEKYWRATHAATYPWFTAEQLSSRVPKEACRALAAALANRAKAARQVAKVHPDVQLMRRRQP